MVNQNIFDSRTAALPATNTFNEAGAPAYAFTAKHALAQYAVTATFNKTFYASAADQLNKILELAFSLDPEFVAKTAVFARTHAQMKDTPALLCAALRGADGPRPGLPREDSSARHRRRQDAALVRADDSLGGDRSKVARHCAEAAGSQLARVAYA